MEATGGMSGAGIALLVSGVGVAGIIAGVIIQHHLTEQSRLKDELRIRYAAWTGAVRVYLDEYRRAVIEHRGAPPIRRGELADQLSIAKAELEREAAMLLLLEHRAAWRARIEPFMLSLRETKWHDELGRLTRTTGTAEELLRFLIHDWGKALDRLRVDLIQRHPTLAVADED